MNLPKRDISLSLQSEIRVSFAKALRAFTFRCVVPLLVILWIIDYIKNSPDIIETSTYYIELLIQEEYWIVLIFLIPLYYLCKDLATSIIVGIFNLLTDLLFPSYIKVYTIGISVRGVGFLPNEILKDIRYPMNHIAITIDTKNFRKPPILKRMLYFGSVKVTNEKNKSTIRVHFDYKKLNVEPKDVLDLLPSIKNDAYKPNKIWTFSQKKRQFSTIANVDEM